MVWHQILNPAKVKGSKSGYKYEFVQVMPDGKLLFTLTTPGKVSHWVMVHTKEQVDLLTQAPNEFHNTYCRDK